MGPWGREAVGPWVQQAGPCCRTMLLGYIRQPECSALLSHALEPSPCLLSLSIPSQAAGTAGGILGLVGQVILSLPRILGVPRSEHTCPRDATSCICAWS